MINTVEQRSENSPPSASESVVLQSGRAARSRPDCVSCDTQTDLDLAAMRQLDLFEGFFKSLPHAALLVDLNVNLQSAKPNILNPSGTLLVSDCCGSLFEDSRVERLNGSLGKLIHAIRRKACQQVTRLDTLYTRVKSAAGSEKTFCMTASTFDRVGEDRALGLLLMEVPQKMKQEMEALESFKSSLMCSLSHELNTPMNSLVPLIKMMPSCVSEDNGDDIKELALASAEFLQCKIRDLIDYTKIEMRVFKLETSEFFVDDLFEEIKLMFQFEVLRKNNVLVAKVKTCRNKKLLVLADKLRIKQVLVKLISNANKFTDRGHIYVSASENRENLNVNFSVRDTGTGMSRSTLSLMFAPLPEKAKYMRDHSGEFARLPGLGLDIAKRICNEMHSTLVADSVHAMGSHFSFEVPICRIHTAELAEGVVGLPRRTDSDDLLDSKRGREMKEISLFGDRVGEKPAVCIPEEKKSQKEAGTKKCDSCMKLLINEPKTAKHSVAVGKVRHYRRGKTLVPRPLIREKTADDTEEEAGLEGIEVSAQMQRYKSMVKVGAGRFTRNAKHRSIVVTTENAVPTESDNFAVCCSKTYMEIPLDTQQIQQRRTEVILITDDLYSNRLVLREMMKRIHVQTIEAINGADAVLQAEKSFARGSPHSIKLILMDLNMPVMDGIQAAARIRQLEEETKQPYAIPIVAVTAHDASHDQNACFEAGMQEYVLKPVDCKTLHRLVREYAPTTVNLFTP